MTAKQKTKSRSKRPIQRVEATVTVRGLLSERLKAWTPVFLGITACVAALTAVYNGWGWVGLPKPVFDSTFHTTIGQVEDKLGRKITETKGEVIQHSDKNSQKVEGEVGVVKKQVDSIARTLGQSRIELLEVQVRTLFQQKTSLVSNLNGVEALLRERPNDTYLLQRKAELDNFIKYVDRDSQAVEERLRRARAGE